MDQCFLVCSGVQMENHSSRPRVLAVTFFNISIFLFESILFWNTMLDDNFSCRAQLLLFALFIPTPFFCF